MDFQTKTHKKKEERNSSIYLKESNEFSFSLSPPSSLLPPPPTRTLLYSSYILILLIQVEGIINHPVIILQILLY